MIFNLSFGLQPQAKYFITPQTEEFQEILRNQLRKADGRPAQRGFWFRVKLLVYVFLASQGAAKQMNKAFLSHVSPPSVQRTQGVVKGQVFK